jgi:hypothetical protein
VPDHNDFSDTGIGFHACAHRYILRLIDAQTPSDAEEARLAFKEGIASALTPSHLIPDVHTIFRWWSERFELELDAFLTAEERQFGSTGESFAPDLVYGRPTGLEIKDFKTFWHPLTEVQIRQDFQARVSIYHAIRIWPNFPSYIFTHEYVRFGTRVSVVFQPSDFDGFADEFEADVMRVQEAERRNEWPETAGPECSFCTLSCSLADHPERLPIRLTLPEQAQLVAAWRLTDDAKRRAANKSLKAYCSANGPIQVTTSAGVVEFDNRPVMQRSYPIDQVLAEMKALGVDADAAVLATDNYSLTISHSALAKIFKAYPELEERLQVAQRQKLTYRFGAKKPGADDDESE